MINSDVIIIKLFIDNIIFYFLINNNTHYTIMYVDTNFKWDLERIVTSLARDN